MRAPTEKQYQTLRNLASGAAGIAWNRRSTEPFLRRGWVTAEPKDGYYSWIRITPDGLRAVALCVERYGWPEIGPEPKIERRVCSECGSTRYHFERVPVDLETGKAAA